MQLKFLAVKTNVQKVTYIKERLISMLPRHEIELLKGIFELLKIVNENSSVNKMNASNLAIVWSPNLVRSDDTAADFAMCSIGDASVNTVVQICIENYASIF